MRGARQSARLRPKQTATIDNSPFWLASDLHEQSPQAVDLKSPFHNEKLISDFSHLRSKQDLLEPPQTTFTEMPILTQRGNNKWTIEQGAYFQSESRRGSRAMQESKQPIDSLNE